MVEMMQYLETDNEENIILSTDRTYERVHALADVMGSDETANDIASIISRAAYDFGRGYYQMLKDLRLYRDIPHERDPRFPYYYKGRLHGDIFVESYGDSIGSSHDMKRRL